MKNAPPFLAALAAIGADAVGPRRRRPRAPASPRPPYLVAWSTRRDLVRRPYASRLQGSRKVAGPVVSHAGSGQDPNAESLAECLDQSTPPRRAITHLRKRHPGPPPPVFSTRRPPEDEVILYDWPPDAVPRAALHRSRTERRPRRACSHAPHGLGRSLGSRPLFQKPTALARDVVILTTTAPKSITGAR